MLANDLLVTLDHASEVMGARMSGCKPGVGLILGSGLGSLAQRIEEPCVIPFNQVPGMGTSTAVGHVGQFVVGTLAGKCVIALQGRLHGYEGYTAQEVAFPVWLMHALGVHTLITTNAAGALNEHFTVGDFCIMADQINMTGRNPLEGIDPNKLAPRFVSMYEAFDPNLRELAHRVACNQHVRVQEGVYVGLLGPSFETPAEVRFLRASGADTVAMSVCEEVIAARHVGMKVLGISLVSNMACGIEGANPTDDEVHVVGQDRACEFATLITGILEQMPG